MPSSSLHFAAPPATELVLPSSQGPQSQGPRKLKLRDSCDACASSKVRCHKEKPTCSRCARRGLVCEYVATRRAGRKHDSSRQSHGSNSTNGTNGTGSHNLKSSAPAAPGAETSAQSHSQPAAAASITVAAVAQQSPVAHSSLPSPSPSLSYLISNLSSPEEVACSDAMPSIPSLTDPTDLDGSSLTNPLSFVVPATWNTDIIGQSYFFPTSDAPNDTSATNIVEIFPSFKFADDVLDFSSDSAGALAQELQTSATTNAPPDVQSLQEDEEEEDTGSAHGLSCCLTKALGLVSKLSPEPAAGCKTSTSVSQSHGGEGAEDHRRPGPTIQTVIATNEATLEALGTMLECSCSEDAYLLVIMSLVVFKVLAWYGAAARKPPSEHDITTTTATSTTTTTTTATTIASITATAAPPAPPMGRSSRSSISSAGSSTAQSPHGATTPSSISRSNKRQLNVVQHQVPAVVKNYYLEGKDSGRMAAQLVLSELHRVQRVVSQLIAKMKALRLAVDGGSSIGRAEEDADATPRALLGGLGLGLVGGDEGGPVLPYSGMILEQLGADMKQKLRTLSIGIVKGLSDEE